MGIGGRRQLIVGVSGSPGSLQALRAAVSEARLTGCPLTAVHTWAPPGGEAANGRGFAPLVDVWVAAARTRLRTAFDEALGGVPDDIDVRLEVVRGTAGRVLVGSTERPEDLIVVGRGDRGPLHRALNGSVSRYCVARARCQVMVVPPPPLLHHARRRFVPTRTPTW